MILEEKRLDGLWWRTGMLPEIAGAASGNDILSGVRSALAEWYHVFLMQSFRLLAAVSAAFFVRGFDGSPLLGGQGSGKCILAGSSSLVGSPYAFRISDMPTLDRLTRSFWVSLSPTLRIQACPFLMASILSSVPVILSPMLNVGSIGLPELKSAAFGKDTIFLTSALALTVGTQAMGLMWLFASAFGANDQAPRAFYSSAPRQISLIARITQSHRMVWSFLSAVRANDSAHSDVLPGIAGTTKSMTHTGALSTAFCAYDLASFGRIMALIAIGAKAPSFVGTLLAAVGARDNSGHEKPTLPARAATRMPVAVGTLIVTQYGAI